MTYDDMIAAAALLASDGDNPEYDRGMAEVIADTVGAIEGMPLDERASQVLADIRALAGGEPARLDFLILTGPYAGREIVSLSLREGIDFLDEAWPEFGDFYILETAEAQ